MIWKKAAGAVSASLLWIAASSSLPGAVPNAPVNLSRLPGTRLTADSVLGQYTADKAADGNRQDKVSRWVSNGETGSHWLKIDFGRKTEFNNIALKFWNDTHIPVDFDIQIDTPSGWKTLKEVRNNRVSVCNYVFPTASASSVRLLFLKSQPDNMVRLYEAEVYNLPYPLELTMSPAFADGLLLDGKKPEIILRNDQPSQVKIIVDAQLYTLRPQERQISARQTQLTAGSQTSVALPAVPGYGSYRYQIKIDTTDGHNIIDRKYNFFYFPPSSPRYLTASPFGAHYHYISETIVNYAGFHWWRNHDVYGRWNYYRADGRDDWSPLRERLGFVRDHRIRECFVMLGAPREYSTILPGEHCESSKSWLYSYYPPSDLKAWVEKYLLPVAAMVKKTAPFRAYEIWNEAWSYYRLRGLHGTAGEAFELFKVSYQTLKKADPDALVYSTDVKPEAEDNRYAFKNFGRDLLDLGYLRYTDLLSYHGYGLANPATIERIRRNAWNCGRDFELWSTETAVEGRPFFMLMESLVLYRANGNGKTFIYTGNRWAPLRLDGNPTLFLVVQAALIRTLGDALPLGSFTRGAIRGCLFANGGHPVAVLFTDSNKAVKIPLPAGPATVAQDIFGKKLDLTTPILSQVNPVIVINPPLRLVKEVLAAQLAAIPTGSASTVAASLKSAARQIAAAPEAQLKTTLQQQEKTLRASRTQADGEVLYVTNPALDLLVNARIMLSRRDRDHVTAPTDLSSMRQKLQHQWEAVAARTGNNGALLNTERLTSRAQKQIQYAMAYDDDGDAIARDILLTCADANLADAASRLKKEKIADIYRSKTYFRSHKRYMRSEVFCFPNGRGQEAVITLANPFGKEFSGTIKLELPSGWKAVPDRIPYRVAPLSRQLLRVTLTAPQDFKPDWTGKITVRDEDNHFPTIAAECEIVKKVPPYPVLRGGISTGTFTGN